MHNLHAKLERINLKSLKHIDQKCKRRKKKKEKPVLFLGKESIKHEIKQKAQLQTTVFNQSLVSDLAFSFGSYQKKNYMINNLIKRLDFKI